MTLAHHPPELAELDITDVDRYVANGYPWHAWDVLRDRAPVYKYERPNYPPFWAVTRYEDVMTVHSHRKVFINGGPILRMNTYDGLAAMDRFKHRQFERFGWDPEAATDMVFLGRPSTSICACSRCAGSPRRRCAGSRPTSPTWRRGSSPSSSSERRPPTVNRSTSSRISPSACRSPPSAG
jgi:hypothetical protein